jgi:hypothetical protein
LLKLDQIKAGPKDSNGNPTQFSSFVFCDDISKTKEANFGWQFVTVPPTEPTAKWVHGPPPTKSISFFANEKERNTMAIRLLDLYFFVGERLHASVAELFDYARYVTQYINSFTDFLFSYAKAKHQYCPD